MIRIKNLLVCVTLFVLDITQSNAQNNWQTLSNAPTNWRHDDCYFLNPDTGWVISPNYSWISQTPNQFGRVFRTTDAGNTWQLLKDSSLTFFRSVGFADYQTGWIGNLAEIPLTPDTIPLYQTQDGGFTWTPVTNIPNPKPAGICGISVVTDSVVYAYGRYNGPPVLIKTIDKGNTWTSTDMSPHATGLVDGYFFNKDTGFVSGNDSSHPTILSTYDGGATWQTRYLSATLYGNLWKLSFPSRNIGYGSIEMNGASFFVKTVDGGLTWIEMPFLAGGYDEEGIGFINDSVGWIGGNNEPYTYKTMDGGNSWNPDLSFGTSIPPYFTAFDINRFRRFGDTLMYASGNTMYKLVYDPSGINEPRLASGFSISPNPTESTIHIQSNNLKELNSTITILDVTGRTLYQSDVEASNGELDTWIDMSKFSSGIYLVQLRDGDQIYSTKVVKE